MGLSSRLNPTLADALDAVTGHRTVEVRTAEPGLGKRLGLARSWPLLSRADPRLPLVQAVPSAGGALANVETA